MRVSESWGQRILRVVDHIQSHLEEDLTPEELARTAELSLHHFHRVFRGMTGETLMGFVRRLRLERGAQRLRFCDDSVTRVALDTGYGTHEGFTRAFRARFGESPSEFRARIREVPEDEHPIVIRSEPERRCVALRYCGDYAVCEQAWEELMGLAYRAGFGGRELASVGLCYDDPDVTRVEHLRYDACLVLDAALLPDPPPARSILRTIPAGNYAVAMHVGGYDSVFETYVTLLGRFLPHRGIELSDEPVVEVYLDDPKQTPAAVLRTEICVRIA